MPDSRGRMTADERAILLAQPIVFRIIAPQSTANRGPTAKAAGNYGDAQTYGSRENEQMPIGGA